MLNAAAVRARRPAAARRARRHQRALDRRARRLRARRVSAAVIVMRFLWVFVHLPARLAVAPLARAGPARPGTSRHRRLDGHARRRVAGGRARDPARPSTPAGLPGPRPHHLPRLRGDPRHARAAGSHAARADPPAGIEDDGTRGERDDRAPAGRAGGDRPHRRAARARTGCARRPPSACGRATSSACDASRRASTRATTARSRRARPVPAAAAQGARGRARHDRPPAQPGPDQRPDHAASSATWT